MIYYDIVPGDQLSITVAPKGFGSENMSQIKMLKPSDGLQGVREFILKVVEEAGPNPCPPIVVGVGIGGTFDKSALIAKKALLRPVDQRNADPKYAALEEADACRDQFARDPDLRDPAGRQRLWRSISKCCRLILQACPSLSNINCRGKAQTEW